MFFHQLTDGIAIGVNDNPITIMVLTISTVIHSIPLSFATGNSFYAKNASIKDPKIFIFFILFILGAPIGMTIGMTLKTQSEAAKDEN